MCDAEDLAFTLMECERRAGVGGEVPASGMLSGRSTDAPETLDGIKLLTQCFKAHADNVEIVEALCALINELIKHGTPALLFMCYLRSRSLPSRVRVRPLVVLR